MNSPISRFMLCFSLIGFAKSQPLYDGRSDTCSVETEVNQKLRKALIDGENLQKQVSRLNKEIQMLKRWIGCPWSWVSYSNSCYKLFLSKESWSDAQVQCSRFGGVLAEITTVEENAFIVDNIVRNASTVSDGVWAGGTDERIEGAWSWWSTNATMSFTYWGRAQPDNWEGEHCLELSKLMKWKWNDYGCDNKLEFLCETEVLY